MKKIILFLEQYSLTKVAFLLCMLRSVVFGASYADAIVLFVVAANYCHKRYEDNKMSIELDKSSDVNMVMLQNQIDQVRNDHESVMKLAEDSKKLLSQGNLAKGLQPRASLRQ